MKSREIIWQAFPPFRLQPQSILSVLLRIRRGEQQRWRSFRELRLQRIRRLREPYLHHSMQQQVCEITWFSWTISKMICDLVLWFQLSLCSHGWASGDTSLESLALDKGGSFVSILCVRIVILVSILSDIKTQDMSAIKVHKCAVHKFEFSELRLQGRSKKLNFFVSF